MPKLFPFETHLQQDNGSSVSFYPHLRARLPTHEHFLKLNFKTCAVVGNSGNLRSKHFGNLIDSHQAVFRMNAPSLLDFVKDVGKKTTIMFSNKLMSSICWTWSKGSEDAKTFNQKPLTIVAIVRNQTEARWIGICQKKYPNINYLIQSSSWHVLARLVLWKYSTMKELHPTTGLLALLGALPVCCQISLFGFPKDNDTSEYHYYSVQNRTIKPWRKHDFSAERKFFRDLEVRGIAVLKEIWPLAMYKDLDNVPHNFLKIFH